MNVNNGNSLLPEDRIEEFKSMLSENGASENTVRVYAASVREFYKNHQELTVDELQDYKRELLKKYRPATVNTRIYGINQYVKYQKTVEFRKISGFLLCGASRNHFSTI